MAKRRGNHEGSLYQRKNKRWSAQIRINGKWLTKTFGTRKEGRLWIKQMQEKIDAGLNWDGAKLTLGEYLPEFLKNIDVTIKPRTLDQYASNVRVHLLPFLKNIKLRELQPLHLQKIYNHLRKKGHSPRNILLVHSIFRRALVLAERQGLISRNPARAITTLKVE